MTNEEILNFWLNQAELRKKMIREEKKQQQIPSIYNTAQDNDIENLCDKINYEI